MFFTFIYSLNQYSLCSCVACVSSLGLAFAPNVKFVKKRKDREAPTADVGAAGSRPKRSSEDAAIQSASDAESSDDSKTSSEEEEERRTSSATDFKPPRAVRSDFIPLATLSDDDDDDDDELLVKKSAAGPADKHQAADEKALMAKPSHSDEVLLVLMALHCVSYVFSSSDAKRSAEASRRCDCSPERSVLR